MSDADDDYMSDKFLCGDIRPSLIQNRAKKRNVEVSEKQLTNIKRQRQHRPENINSKLQESLQRPIDSNNKGFQMLAKMGYKQGKPLGKTTEDDETLLATEQRRLIEPIGLSIKNDRSGLGREDALRELAEKRQLLLRRKHANVTSSGGDKELSTEEFRQHINKKNEELYVTRALRRSQLTCENLDTRAGIDIPDMIWFWPNRHVVEEETVTESDSPQSTQEESIYTDMEKLEMLAAYLRTSYHFCIWCAVCYQDKIDLNENCPGLTRDEH